MLIKIKAEKFIINLCFVKVNNDIMVKLKV